MSLNIASSTYLGYLTLKYTKDYPVPNQLNRIHVNKSHSLSVSKVTVSLLPWKHFRLNYYQFWIGCYKKATQLLKLTQRAAINHFHGHNGEHYTTLLLCTAYTSQ